MKFPHFLLCGVSLLPLLASPCYTQEDAPAQRATQQEQESELRNFLKSPRLTSAKGSRREEDGTPLPDGAQQEALRNTMRQLHIDTVYLAGASLPDVLEFMRRELRKNALQAALHLEVPRGTSAEELPVVNLRMQNVSGERLLKLACQQTNCRYEWQNEAVVIYPATGAERMQRRHWYVKQELFERIAPERNLKKELLTILKEQGIEFPQGSSASYNAKYLKLTAFNTRANLDDLEDFLADCNEKSKGTRASKNTAKEKKGARKSRRKH